MKRYLLIDQRSKIVEYEFLAENDDDARRQALDYLQYTVVEEEDE